MTELQRRVLAFVFAGLNGHRTLTEVGCLRKVRGWKESGTLGRPAALAVLRALERRGLACVWRAGNDEWAPLKAAATPEGARELYCPRRPELPKAKRRRAPVFPVFRR